jgi:hypothetical protein
LPEKWTGYSQHSRDCLPLPTKYLPAHEVLRFRDEAFVKYYTDRHYLEMIAQRFGSETVLQIEQMTRHKLERDLLTGKLSVASTTLATVDGDCSEPSPLIQLGSKTVPAASRLLRERLPAGVR